jgi:protein-S-isoprenylcysteine O-methyltransferase Ste14
MRWLRLRAVWLLVIPFLWLAHPTGWLLVAGGALGALGLAVRAWAAGLIRKDAELMTQGPYAHTRNPLYLGSLLLGLGAVVAGGRWWFVAAFLVFFIAVYGPTMKREEVLLENLFGEHYRSYAANVPLLAPKLLPYRTIAKNGDGKFSLQRYRANREFDALVGALLGFGFLAVKLFWM